MQQSDSEDADSSEPSAEELVARGLALHQTGSVEEAASLYARAIELDPDHAEAVHLLGVARLAQQRLNEALPLLARATALAPQNPQYYANLGVALNAAESHAAAIRSLDRAIALRPDFAEAYSNRGMACRALGEFDEAADSYQRAIELKPHEAGFHFNLANALEAAGRPHEALAAMDKALELRPRSAAVLAGVGRLLEVLRRYDDALAAAERAAALAPDDPDVLRSLASILARTGRVEQSLGVYRRVLGLKPTSGHALHELSYRRRHSSWSDDLEAMARVFRDTAVSPKHRGLAGIAFGKALADLGDHQRSHDVYVEANALLRADQPYSLPAALSFMERMARQFQAIPERLRDAGYMDAAPIFVLGQPRAGKTTMEQLLSSSPGAWAAGELGRLRLTVAGLLPPGERSRGDALSQLRLDEIEPGALRDAGASYVDYVRSLDPRGRTGIDTMPVNFQLIGFIKLMLPRARIVHAVRDPLDHVVAMFEKRFRSPAYGYTCVLSELRAYYLAYRQMMDLWDDLWPGAILSVSLQELRADPRRVAELFDFCGLPIPRPAPAVADSEPEIGALPAEQAAEARKRHLEPYRNELSGLPPLATRPPARPANAL